MQDKKSKRIEWSPKTVKINKIQLYENNPRIITEDGLRQLEASFDEVGVFEPLAINTDNKLLSGHARIMQLIKDGYKEVTVMVPDRKLTPKQEKALVIRANKTVAGQWDFDVLANKFDQDDLKEWGFSEHELGMEKWDSDIEAIDKIEETLSGIEGKIIITCPQDLKDEVLIYLKAKLLETSFEGVHIE